MAAGDVEVNITSPNAKAGAIFDGVDDRVSTLATLNPVEGTISFWAYAFEISGAGDKGLVGDRHDQTDNWQIQIQHKVTTGFIKVTTNNAPSSLQTTTGLGTFEWHHIVFTWNATETKLYFDGTLEDTDVAANITAKTSHVDIGRYFSNLEFPGVISDIRIYSRALTQTEVTQLNSGDTSLINPLLHNWKLDIDYTDSAGTADGTNSGSRLGTVDETIATAIKADRTTANDVYLIADSGNGKQAISVIIEET